MNRVMPYGKRCEHRFTCSRHLLEVREDGTVGEPGVVDLLVPPRPQDGVAGCHDYYVHAGPLNADSS